MLGFSGVLPTGIWPATALSNMGTTSFLKSQDHTVKSYGFGVFMQANISKHFSLFFDGNAYNYNIFLAKKGADVQTVWTVEEMATHWNEAGAPQIQYVHNLPTDVHFDMQATGFRLGGTIMGNNKIHPWAGAAFDTTNGSPIILMRIKPNLTVKTVVLQPGLHSFLGLTWNSFRV